LLLLLDLRNMVGGTLVLWQRLCLSNWWGRGLLRYGPVWMNVIPRERLACWLLCSRLRSELSLLLLGLNRLLGLGTWSSLILLLRLTLLTTRVLSILRLLLVVVRLLLLRLPLGVLLRILLIPLNRLRSLLRLLLLIGTRLWGLGLIYCWRGTLWRILVSLLRLLLLSVC